MILRVLISFLFMLLLNSCNSCESPRNSSPIVSIGVEYSKLELNPRKKQNTQSLLFNRLTHCRLKSNNKAVQSKEIAKEIITLPNGKINVVLAQNIKFSDSLLLTPEIVVNNFQHLRQGHCDPIICQQIDNIKSITSLPPNKIEIELIKPETELQSIMDLAILHPENLGKSFDNTAPSCGLYKASYNEKSTKLIKNSRNSSSLAKKIIFKPYNSEIAMNHALLNKDIDFLITFRPSFHFNLNTSKRNFYTKKMLDYAESSFLNISIKDPKLSIPKLITTLVKSIDQKAIHNFIYKEAPSIPINDLKFKLLKNKLDSIGFLQPELDFTKKYRFNLKLTSSIKESDIIVAKAISSQWSKLGINLKIQIINQTSSVIPSLKQASSDLWLSHEVYQLNKDPKTFRLSQPFTLKTLELIENSIKSKHTIQFHLWDKSLYLVYDKREHPVFNSLPIKNNI